jgi:Ca2+-binding RTX toxin-like protein
MGPAGEWVIAYRRTPNSPSDPNYGQQTLHARSFARGAPAPEFVVSHTTEGQLVDIDVAMNAANEYVIIWNVRPPHGGQRSYTRLYRGPGTPLTDDEWFRFGEPGNYFSAAQPTVGIDDDSSFVVVFYGQPIQGQAFAGADDTRPSCRNIIATIVGTPGADSINGGAGADVIQGFAGNDRIDGGGGADVICGGGHADVIFGGPGNDLMNGGWGDDVLDGGGGLR